VPDNLIVCYRLAEGEAEARIGQAIQELGDAVQVMPSVWYVASSYAPGEAAEHIRSVMSLSSALLVINASTDELAWFNLDRGEQLQGLWDKATA
jgi:hypothetical protein